MNREEFHEQDIDRYKFDFNLCTAEKGYAQIDTSQDAWYYGNWANPNDLKIVSYCEGDVTITTYNHSNGFVRQIRELKEFHNRDSDDGFKGIDAMLNDGLTARFTQLGLADLLH